MAPGEKRKAELEIPCSELAVYDVAGRRKIVEEGEYLFAIGGGKPECRNFIKGETTFMRDPVKLTAADHYDDYENIVLCHAGGGQSSASVLKSEKRAVLFYRDFVWTGEESSLVMNLRSRHKGGVRVFITEEEKGTEGQWKHVISWKGARQEFSKVILAIQKENLKGQISRGGTDELQDRGEELKIHGTLA